MATVAELLVVIVILLVLGTPLLLLILKLFRGDFWPPELIEQYRKGKQRAKKSENE